MQLISCLEATLPTMDAVNNVNNYYGPLVRLGIGRVALLNSYRSKLDKIINLRCLAIDINNTITHIMCCRFV